MAVRLEIDVESAYDRHKSGVPIVKVAQELGCSRDTLERRFRKRNLRTVTKTDVYSHQFEIVSTLLRNGHSLTEIGAITGIPVTQIHRLLKSCGVVNTHTNFDFRHKSMKYTLNEGYFDNIDHQDKSYILGFLYADGNAHSKHKHISLKLQETDVDILLKISEKIGSNKPLHFSKTPNPRHKDQFCLKITNTVMYNDLVRHGVVPRKTFITRLPSLGTNLYPHFIRGLFDGDGCLSVDFRQKSGSYTIMGSTYLCVGVQNLLRKVLGVRSYLEHDSRCKSGVDRIRIRRYRDIVDVCDWMYHDAELYLERKRRKYLELRKLKNDNV